MVFPDEIKTKQVTIYKTLGVDFPRVFCRGRELSRVVLCCLCVNWICFLQDFLAV